MDRSITLTAFVLLFFSTAFNPALIPTSFNKTPDSYSKSVLANSSTNWVPDNHTRIQWAINNASDGDTIFIRAGTYYEHLVVDKALSLVGENKHDTIIDGNGTGTAVHVIGNNITLRNFTVQNAELGIWLLRSGNVILTGNTASNSRYGIFVGDSYNNILSGNDASNNQNGIYLSRSSNNLIANNTSSDNGYGIYLDYSGNNLIANNTSSDNGYGIYLSRSSNNLIANNTSSDNGYGIYLLYSGNSDLTGNNVSSNNDVGIYLLHSGNSDLTGNNVSSNNDVGIYLDSSSYNTLTGNNVSSNNDDGIHLYHSGNVILTGNTASNSRYGIFVGDSYNNILSGNDASNNQNGIYLYYSRDNILTSNNATNNQYGISISSSINDVIFNNNFINNAEPASITDSVNSWDNGAEGNYWSDYDGSDANQDGIGDTPYPIDENIQDNYPLMATFLQFKIATEKQSYKIGVVCNSIISNLQYNYKPQNRINAVSFKVNVTEGKGFCRISIPHALIKPPYTVTVDHNSPSYSKIAYTNGTRTWLYFTYDPTEHEVMIMHMPYPEQLLISRWAIVGLSAVIVILLSISINYYRKFNKQKKIIQEYERELGNFPVSHSERARARFVKDVIGRKEKIENFKRKYGIKIQPATTLEDLIEKLGVKKEKS